MLMARSMHGVATCPALQANRNGGLQTNAPCKSIFVKISLQSNSSFTAQTATRSTRELSSALARTFSCRSPCLGATIRQPGLSRPMACKAASSDQEFDSPEGDQEVGEESGQELNESEQEEPHASIEEQVEASDGGSDVDPDEYLSLGDYEEKGIDTGDRKPPSVMGPLGLLSAVLSFFQGGQGQGEPAGGKGEDESQDAAGLADEYSSTMQAAMQNASLVYRHELGMNFNRVLPQLIVGSCLQTPADVDILRDSEGVGSVLCLQQDSDLQYFGLDLGSIIQRTEERGDIRHIRAEIRDFDPFSLRLELPVAVAKLHKAQKERGTVYVHCTAGLGRAPAVALAYMWWMCGYSTLEQANEVLQAVRPCGPKLFAIRAALCDLLTGNPTEPVTVVWKSRGTTPESVEVAGLDVGWHNRLALQREPRSQWWKAQRELPVGTYYYKFIVDGHKWTYNPDAPLTKPDKDNNVNNFAEVQGLSLSPDSRALRKRLMEDGSPLPDEERAAVMQRIDELAASL